MSFSWSIYTKSVKMAVLEWKKFDFFNLSENVSDYATNILKNHEEESLENEITCSTSGHGQKVLGDSSGKIYIFYRNWKNYNSFQGYEPGTSIVLCELTPLNNHLVTVGYKSGNSAEVKIWNLTKAKNKQTPCLKSFKTTIQRQKPTALAVINNGVNSQIFLALGFERGDLILYKGDPTKSSDFSYTALQISNSISTRKITGISFNLVGKQCHLFICSDNVIIAYEFNSQIQLQQNSEKEFNKQILDCKNAPSRCCTLQVHQETYFLVGRDDAIYYFTIDGRGPCYALEGQKILIKSFGNYLVTILKTNKPQPQNKEFTIIVIDIQNKFIVFSCPIEEIIGILNDDNGSVNGCYLISKTKNIYHLNEKDLQTKLSLLFKKNLFDIAVRISKDHKKEDFDEAALSDIYRLYGDHLYFKGNYSLSIEKYIDTIPFLEPSYVIKKFLDCRHINFLANYLQALVDKGYASDEHKILLRNCSKRLELPNNLESPADSFIDFEGDNILQISDSNKLRSLLKDMNSLDVKIFIENNAFNIMKKDPVEAIRLFTGISEDHLDIEPDTFIQYFYKDQRDLLIEFLESFINKTENENVYNTLIEFYLQKFSENNEDEDLMLEKLKVFEGKYNKEFVLILCRFYKFWPGILYIYEEKDLHNLSIRYYHQRKDYGNMIKSCENFGNNNPNLWIQALNGSDSTILPTNVLLQVLGVISREKLLSPLQIADALSVENGPKVGQVKDYFLDMFKRENEQLEQENDEVTNLKQDVVTLSDYIKNCKENPIEFGNTACNACNQPLSLPSIYYLCRHAFHQDCVKSYSVNEKDCSVCMKENLRLNELIQRSTSQMDEQLQNDTFHNTLNRSKDHLQVLSQYFSRGLFNKICIVEEKDENTPPPVKVDVYRFVEQKEVQKESTKPKPSINPFGDEEDYDKAKNPFEIEDEDSDKGVGNPFEEEYDSNLNPFN